MPPAPDVTSGTRPVAARIGEAVRAWLGALDDAQRSRASFAFDDAERFAWDYRPGPRRGLPLADMTVAQRAAAFGVMDAAMSERGATEVHAIIDLEPILGALERAQGRGGLRRDPDLYWFAVFGSPGGAVDDSAPWSWRIGGHHVAVQITVADGRVVGSAPSFLGANPATVPSGPTAGSRAIDGEERLARAFLATLTGSQRAIAMVDPVAPPDILSGIGRRAALREVPIGIRVDQLEAAQRASLERLIRHYLQRADTVTAGAEWDRIAAAGLSSVTFAWAGSDVPGRGHYYAIRGPSLLIEYDNTQNGASHIHSVWRDPANDWGEDFLAAHYRAHHSGG
jgi:hypothetical protein